MSALLQAPGNGTAEPDGGISDHKLVAAVRRGDDRAFEALYERYHRRIHAYVYGMVKDHQRAEDVTQEVFVSALRRMRATERPIAFKPWVYEIAKNACIDQFRRSKRAEEVSFDADEGLAPSDYGRLVSPEPVPDAALAAKQQLEQMVGAFGGLSDAHHQILVLRELEGLSYREIGETHGHEPPGRREHALPRPPPALGGVRRARLRPALPAHPVDHRDRGHAAASAPATRAASRATSRTASRAAARRSPPASTPRWSPASPLRQRAVEKVAALFPIPLLLRAPPRRLGRRAGRASCRCSPTTPPPAARSSPPSRRSSWPASAPASSTQVGQRDEADRPARPPSGR